MSASAATGVSKPGLPFPVEEYQERWGRLYDEIRSRGYETAVIWQRSGGGFDRAGDLHWLCGYASLASGQEPAWLGSPGRGFAALVFTGAQEPELHIAEPADMIDHDTVATTRIVSNPDLHEGVAAALRAAGVEGPVLHNGDDFIPAGHMRRLQEANRDIEWVPVHDLLWVIHRIKSPLERDAMRQVGVTATRALTALMEGLIAGERECEAASKAAREIIAGGGSFQRIGAASGPISETVMWSSGLYGYGTKAPQEGHMVRGWVDGPIHAGLWADPGRVAVCGNRPTPEQRNLIESAAGVVEALMAAIRPGVTAEEVGALGDRLMEEAGNEIDEDLWDLYGHGIGKDFYMTPIIPRLGRLPGLGGTYEEGMAVTVELFLRHKGVGWATFEVTGLVEAHGFEALDKTPLIFW
jgi:Xaa-Pro aminopeptidase